MSFELNSSLLTEAPIPQSADADSSLYAREPGKVSENSKV